MPMAVPIAIGAVVGAGASYALTGDPLYPFGPATTKKNKMPDIPGLPQAPSADDAEAKARAEAVKRRAGAVNRSKTILTSEQGILGQAPLATKTLLGQ